MSNPLRERYVCGPGDLWHSIDHSESDGRWAAVCGRMVLGTSEVSAVFPSTGRCCNCVYSAAELLAFHAISKHCNIAAIHNSFSDNWDYHHEDHYGPGGIRNHPFDDRSFDEEKVEKVLEEGESE